MLFKIRMLRYVLIINENIVKNLCTNYQLPPDFNCIKYICLKYLPIFPWQCLSHMHISLCSISDAGLGNHQAHVLSGQVQLTEHNSWILEESVEME